jgi:acyl carrier protein
MGPIMNREEIEQKIRDIIANRMKNETVREYSSEDPLMKLGIDSLTFSWIIADMEDTFNFVMIGSDILKLKTLNQATDYIETKIQS